MFLGNGLPFIMLARPCGQHVGLLVCVHITSLLWFHKDSFEALKRSDNQKTKRHRFAYLALHRSALCRLTGALFGQDLAPHRLETVREGGSLLREKPLSDST